MLLLALSTTILSAHAGTVRGRVLDNSGKGIAGVTITIVQVGGELGPWTAITGSDGAYSIKDSLIFGNLEATPRKAGFVFNPSARTVFDVDPFVADFQGFDRPVVNAPAVVFDENGAAFSTQVLTLGLITKFHFEYGPTPALGFATPTRQLLGQAAVPVREQLFPVPEGDALFVRAVASNSIGLEETAVTEFKLPLFNSRFAFTRPGISRLSTLRSADFDGDGLMDFAWVNGTTAPQASLYRGTQPFQWQAQALCDTCSRKSPIQTLVSAEWLALDTNNLPDLTVSQLTLIDGSQSFGTNDQFSLLSQGHQLIADKNAQGFGVPSLQMLPSDLNHDGKTDLVYVTPLGLFIGLNQGSLRMGLDSAAAVTSDTALADFNKDGHPDLISAYRNQDSILELTLFSGNGTPFPTLPNTGEPIRFLSGVVIDRIPGISMLIPWIGAGDFDGDGATDFAVCLIFNQDRFTAIYWNDGNGAFPDHSVLRTPLVENAISSSVPTIATGDFENDGLEDILIVSTPSELISAPHRIMRSLSTNLGLGTNLVECAVIDADQDGRLDLLVAGQASENNLALHALKNQTAAVNHPPDAPHALTAERQGADWILKWQPGGDDLTPAASLTYNVRVGLTPGGNEIMAALSDPQTGRHFVPRRGNADATGFLRIRVPESVTTLHWSVQAVDAGFLGGLWAPEQTLQLIPPASLSLSLSRFDADGSVVIRATGAGANTRLLVSEDLKIWNEIGPFQQVAPGIFEARDSRPKTGARFYGATQ